MSDLDNIRARHVDIDVPAGEPYVIVGCQSCSVRWPCDTAQVLAVLDATRMERDAVSDDNEQMAVLLDAANADAERLRGAAKRARTAVVYVRYDIEAALRAHEERVR